MQRLLGAKTVLPGRKTTCREVGESPNALRVGLRVALAEQPTTGCFYTDSSRVSVPGKCLPS